MAAPVIDEVELPTDIARGAVFGPGYSTVVVISASGSEQRIAQRSQGLYQGQIEHLMRTAAQAQAIEAFFHARQGKARGFRFKDWGDYSVTNEPLTYPGGPTIQLIKTYTSGSVSRVRNIYKPVASPAVTLRHNAGAFAAFTLDTTTGLVTLTPLAGPFTITNITQDLNGLVTTTGWTGLSTASFVYFTGIVGMTQLNGMTAHIASVPNGTQFSILTDTTNFSPYVSGGSVSRYYALTDTWDWTGQFDVPVRFDVDILRRTQQDVSYFDYTELPIVELLG